MSEESVPDLLGHLQRAVDAARLDRRGQLPIRQKSANGQPPEKWDAARTCYQCHASFRGLAPGKTGERGLWSSARGMRWYCSQECFDAAGEALP